MGEAPENTLVSFQKAVEHGADLVEMDVRVTREGEVVIIHDAMLDRTTNGRGRVNRKGLKELKALDAGCRFTPDGGASYPYRDQRIEIPTLEEFLSTCAESKAIIEIKQARSPIVETVVGTVLRMGREGRVLLATENDQIMRMIRHEIARTQTAVATGFSYGEVEDFMAWLAGGQRAPLSPPGQALQIPCEYGGMTLVSKQTVKGAHDLGIEIFVWTVNEIREMERLLRLDVDGIITDYPARLSNLLSRERP